MLANNQKLDEEASLNFHQLKEKTNSEYGLQIERNNELKTVSITQCLITSESIKMSYLDLME